MNVQMYDFNDNLIVVPMFQLLQWKHSINLEMKGLKNSRGSVTAHVRRKLSAPKSYKREHLYDHLVAVVEDIDKQLNPDDGKLRQRGIK